MQDQNFIDNEWRPARSGATDDIVNPATGAVIGTAPASRRRRRRRRRAAAAGAPSRRGRPRRPAERSEALHELARRDRGRHRAPLGDRVGERRQARLDHGVRDGPHARQLEVLRGGGPLPRGPRRRRVHGGLHVDAAARAPRRGRVDRPVELPAQHGHVEGGAGAGGRQHRRAQAVRAHALHRAAPGRAGGRRPPAGRAQRRVRPGRDRGRRARRAPGRGDGVAHRLGGGRQGRSPRPRPRRSSACTSSSAARRRSWCSTTPTRPRSRPACARPATTTPARTAPPRAG